MQVSALCDTFRRKHKTPVSGMCVSKVVQPAIVSMWLCVCVCLCVCTRAAIVGVRPSVLFKRHPHTFTLIGNG